ncbi:MAG TPA: hypothetical protein VM219_00875 [Phycisphaerae bacterium]|nr:hypothetical protein [Phycisphaerae bacterium]
MVATITALDNLTANLDTKARERFDRLYEFTTSEAHVLPPPPMEDWIAKAFAYLAPTREKILETIRRQRIVHVMNRVTGQATLFNAIRAQRPIEAKDTSDLETEIEAARAKCAFCRPMELTPENTFGRIGGDKTCANVAAYDGYHGLVIFEDHSPLRFRTDAFGADEVADLLATSRQWAEKARAENPEARFFFLMWNCLWKAGASIIHGHAQMTLGRKFHYGKVERLRRDARRYRQDHGADYFEDLVAVHDSLGLAARWGEVTALAHLTPAKEKELILLCPALDAPDTASAIHRALRIYAGLDVKAYNLAVYMPPLGPADAAWEGFPVLVHLVDRGDPGAKTADIGAMELYASAVVSSDPFDLAEALKT